MALSTHDAFAAGGGGRRRRRRGRRGALSEINVTPLVDVMLVLLIIFMISAPLLTPSAVPLELPETEASAMPEQKNEPITLSVQADGKLFIGDTEIPFAALRPRLDALAGSGYDQPIYVRADGKVAYEVVARVTAALAKGGYTKINLITDTGGPSSGGSSAPAALKPAAE